MMYQVLAISIGIIDEQKKCLENKDFQKCRLNEVRTANILTFFFIVFVHKVYIYFFQYFSTLYIYRYMYILIIFKINFEIVIYNIYIYINVDIYIVIHINVNIYMYIYNIKPR